MIIMATTNTTAADGANRLPIDRTNGFAFKPLKSFSAYNGVGSETAYPLPCVHVALFGWLIQFINRYKFEWYLIEIRLNAIINCVGLKQVEISLSRVEEEEECRVIYMIGIYLAR